MIMKTSMNYKNLVICDSKDKVQGDSQNEYRNMEVGLPREADNQQERAMVKRRAIGSDGNPVGRKHTNPLLDTRQFEVEFINGTVEVLKANVIAENLLDQVDDEGHRQLMMDAIIDHRKNNDVMKTVERSKSTNGLDFCVLWKDGSTSWLSLKELKEGYMVPTANYAVQNKLDKMPAFRWWVPHVLKKAKIILSKVKSKYWERTHKYGIRTPKSTKEAYKIDMENGNTFWSDAIKEEAQKIKGAIREYNGDVDNLVGYQG